MKLDDFKYRPDMAADEIPHETVDLGLPRKPPKDVYVTIPATDFLLHPPLGRLLMLARRSLKVFGPDASGDWVRLNLSHCQQFGLDDRNVRHRAVNAAVKAGVLEARRAKGKTTLVRFPPKPRKARS